jgi:flagellar basal body-associated protein FliL
MNNIKVEELEKIKNELETKYDKIEKKLLKMNSKMSFEEISNLEKKQDLIDEQIDLIDRIVLYINDIPNLYKKILDNKEKLDNM